MDGAVSHEYETELQKLSQYADKKLNGIFKLMMTSIFEDCPEDPVSHMITFLQDYQAQHLPTKPSTQSEMPVFDVPDSRARGRGNARRSGISAEPIDMSTLTGPTRVIEKTPEEESEIRDAVTSNILFQSLDKEQLRVVVAAMEKQTFAKGDWIIRQGDEGHEFYIVASGTCETFIRIGDEDKMVKVYSHGEAFGELALMYNTPRKASIQASADVRLWAMDRQTFRRVLMESTCEKRGRYETFLARVPVLQTLDNYERSKVADALVERDFAAGSYVITMGDTADTSFYILLEGAAAATKTLAGDSSPVTVMEYQPGDYFGELALLSAAPRAANVVAVSACKCVCLDREAFERLLGPCQEVLQRDQDKYKAVEARLQTVNKN